MAPNTANNVAEETPDENPSRGFCTTSAMVQWAVDKRWWYRARRVPIYPSKTPVSQLAEPKAI